MSAVRGSSPVRRPADGLGRVETARVGRPAAPLVLNPPEGRRGLLPHEISQGDTDGVGDTDQGVEERGLLALLDPHDGRPVDPDA